MSETRGLTLDPSCPVDWSHDLNRGLVGDWTPAPLPGWSGGLTLRDLVRGGRKPNDGTLTTGCGWATGPHGFRAVRNNTAGAYVDTTLELASRSVWSIRWVGKVFSAGLSGGYGAIFGTETGRSFQLICEGNVSQQTFRINGSIVFVFGNLGITAGPTFDVVITRDASNIRTYVNGLLNRADSVVANSASSHSLRWGYDPDGGSGDILTEQGQFFSTALSSSQVAALYDQRRRGSPDLYRWLRPWSFGVTVAGAAPPNSGSGESVGIGVATGAGATARSGSGSAIGVGAAAGEGATARTGSGESTGIGVATGAGSATHSGAGESVGLGAATGAGLATHSGSGATVGVGVATGAGVATHSGSGESAGIGTATGAGIAAHSGGGDAIGIGLVTGAGAATHSGSGASIGVGVATGEGDAPGVAAAGSGESVGVGVATGAGYAVRGGSGEAIGVGAATGAGETARSGSGESLGIGVVTGAGSSGGRGGAVRATAGGGSRVAAAGGGGGRVSATAGVISGGN